MERQRLIHALLFFTQSVRHPGKTKLAKLLFHLDFEHFEKKGRPVTGLEYKAFPEGPIPPTFILDEWNYPPDDLRAVFKLRRRPFSGGKLRGELVPKDGVRFDPSYFTALQLQIMEKLATKYFSHTATEMSDDSHQESGIWFQVWSTEGRKQGVIPYSYALLRKGRQEDLALLEYAEDREAFLRSLRK